MDKLKELYAKSNALSIQVEALRAKATLTAEEDEELTKLLNEWEQTENTIDREEKVNKLKEKAKEPENRGWRPKAEAKTHQGPRVFKSFIEQLVAVKNFAQTGRMDDRLIQVNNAAAGSNEGNLVEGGFAIQQDFGGLLMDSAAQAGDILSRVDQYQISGNANSIKWIEIQEDNIATTVFGGVRVYWAAEGNAVDSAKPTLKEKELKLEKLMGLAYTTYEMDADSNFIDQLYQRAFELAIRRELESCIVAGTGAGKPLGLTKSLALVEVDKQTNQPAGTVTWPNLSAMYNRRLLMPGSNYIWLCHPDMQEQFDFLEFPVGVGGVPVYLQQTSVGQLSTIKGLPIVPTDHCSAIGTVGDILLTDLKDYAMIYKGGIDSADSIHVEFLTAQRVFRFIMRANGMPKTSIPVLLKNTTKRRSPITALQTRS
jgi:HK97 family phage major capsid protein